jgi:hypothetical protein
LSNNTPQKISRVGLALAFAEQEGWFNSTIHGLNRPQRDNNPGDLEWAPTRFVQGIKDGPYCRFPSWLIGWAALENDLDAKIKRGLNLYETINIYCPVGDADNDPLRYCNNVAGNLGIDPYTPLIDLVSEVAGVREPWKKAPKPGLPCPDWLHLANYISANVTI